MICTVQGHVQDVGMFWQMISRNMALLTLIAAVAAYLFPSLFLVFKDYFLGFFAATMFALGLVMQPEEAKKALARPSSIGIGVATQYIAMPLLGFGAAMIATWQGASPAIALGFIIVACAPGAMASNVISYLLGGSIAFSIAMTLLATLLSPFLTPLLTQWLGGAYMDIPLLPMMKTIAMTVIFPLLTGMVLRHFVPQHQAHYERIAPAVAAIAIIVICSYAVAANQTRIAATPWVVCILVVALNAAGYVIGWIVASLCHFERAYRVTLSIEIGMQNAGLGVALALKHFSPESALPGALFAVWCILTAAGLSRLMRQEDARAA